MVPATTRSASGVNAGGSDTNRLAIDIADAWEREGEDPMYFYTFSPKGYAFGINAVLYAMIH